MAFLKKHPVLILIIIFSLLIFSPVLGLYFSGDDFFHFKVAMTGDSIASFLRLFGFYPFSLRGIAFYRPLPREILFNIFYSLFGLTALPFRVISLSLYAFDIFLTYKFILQFLKDRKVALFVSFFFGISSANVSVLYYLAGGIQSQFALTFTLLSLISYEDKHFFRTFVFFLCALASHEIAIALPFLILGINIVDKRKKMREIVPFFIVLAIYLFLDVYVIGFSPNEVQYKPVFNIKTFANTFSWYTAWAFGVPEMLIDFVKPGLKLDPRLMRYWGGYFKVIFLSAATSATLLLFAILRARKRYKDIIDKRLIFLVFWFVVAVSPMVFLPFHKSTYYLEIALPAFWGMIGYLLFKVFKASKFATSLLILSFAVLNIVSVRLGDTTYWAGQRDRIAGRLIESFKTKYPTLSKGAIVYVKNDPDYPFVSEDWGGTSKQASFVLSGSDALELLYHDPSLKVYYEDIGSPPEGADIVDFVAVIN